ncbi:MAG: molybdopterin molybdotransferase MoeA [Acidobacteriota bacterium]|nr:molybdopterin molybdotransferase MoeA [Acidobacteriota bacterium]
MWNSAEPKQAISFEAARKIVIETLKASKLGASTEQVPLAEAHGRVLGRDVLADRDYPALRRSLRDGFAVRSSDVPGTLKVRGEVRAGVESLTALQPGHALEIMTGAPVPEGADAVVMIEHVSRDGDEVNVQRPAERGQFINERGSEARQGTVLIPKGVPIDASHIAALAMTGHTNVNVAKGPRVAILATGDEIVELDQSPSPHQIRNSNSYMLASLVRAAGGVPTILPIARDTPDALRSLMKQGLEHDILIVSGGVSAGKYDLVKPTLREFGTQFHFERVLVQPGQPTAFGICHGKPVFGLPGNPGSSLITFQLFARPAIQILSGDADPLLPLLSATFESPFRHKPGLTRFLPARLANDGKSLRHIPWQGSSDIPALARANAFLVAEHDRETWQAGDSIRVMLKP